MYCRRQLYLVGCFFWTTTLASEHSLRHHFDILTWCSSVSPWPSSPWSSWSPSWPPPSAPGAPRPGEWGTTAPSAPVQSVSGQSEFWSCYKYKHFIGIRFRGLFRDVSVLWCKWQPNSRAPSHLCPGRVLLRVRCLSLWKVKSDIQYYGQALSPNP